MKFTSIEKWIRNSLWQSVLVPIVIIEIALIVIYYSINSWQKDETISFLDQNAEMQLSQIANVEAESLQSELLSINHITQIYQSAVIQSISEPREVDDEYTQRMVMNDDGAYYTVRDSEQGGVAIFYSGFYPIGTPEKVKLNQLMAVEPLMKQIIASEPNVSSIYFNTYDSLNIIYPYFDVISQYMIKMDIPSFNFYYEADLKHNPSKAVVWTDVYLDPAGHGWMASAIAPVYNQDFLEGVVGLDVTVDTFVGTIESMKIPWNGYALLVGEDGTILALPSQGEDDWNLKEITTHSYSEAIYADTFKPSEFNMYTHLNNPDDVKMIKDNPTGSFSLMLNNQVKQVSWSTIDETGWKLFIIASQSDIYAPLNKIQKQLIFIGYVLSFSIILFLIVLLAQLTKNAQMLSKRISNPLKRLNEMMLRIGNGQYRVDFEESEVEEFNQSANIVKHVGLQLESAIQNLSESEQRYNLALEGAGAALWDWDIKNNVYYFSPLFKKILGLTDEEVVELSNTYTTLIHPEDVKILENSVIALRQRKLSSLSIHIRMKHKEGQWIWIASRGGVIFDESGEAVRFIGTNTDITEAINESNQNRLLQQNLTKKETSLTKLTKASQKDTLTKAYNRYYFETEIRNQIRKAQENKEPVSIAMVDLDFFKNVNDQFGHDIGDLQLKKVVALIKKYIRNTDVIIRYGGEEFLVVMFHTTQSQSKRVCEKVRTIIDETIFEHTHHQTISCGITEVKPDESLETAIKRADQGLYHAKNSGRNKVVHL